MKILAFIPLLLAVLCSCTLHDEVAGGSDHPNELVGKVLPASTSTGSAKTMVELYQVNANSGTTSLARMVASRANLPQRVALDTCDANGLYHFDSVATGSYYIQAFVADSSMIVLGSPFTLPQKGGLLTLNDMQLSLPGSITLHLGDPGTFDISDTLFLVGTHYYALLNSQGNAEFPFVPQGTYKLADLNGATLNIDSVKAVYSVPIDTLNPIDSGYLQTCE
jgi:hypothetical protein